MGEVRRSLILVVVLCACVGRQVEVERAGEDTEASAGTLVSPPPENPPTETRAATTDTVPSTTAAPEDDESEATADTYGFIQDPDVKSPYTCNPSMQDCPNGQKCMWYSDDKGSWWNATACFPVAEDPDQLDEPCTVEGDGASGVDSCDVGLMCWDLDPDTLQGDCIAYCVDAGNEFVCPEGPYYCASNQDGFAVCIRSCDPLVQDCPAGKGCYGVDSDFFCARVSEAAQYGDACQRINECAAGLNCIAMNQVPGCESGYGCCSSFCDVTLPNTCPGEGQACVPWYAEGQAPPDLDHVGVCALML